MSTSKSDPNLSMVIAELRDENAALKNKLKAAEARIQALEQERKEAREPESVTLDETQKKVLICVANGNRLMASTIAERVHLHRLVADQVLHQLAKLDFILEHIKMAGPRTYALGRRGRDYIISNNLLDKVTSSPP